MNKKNKYYAYKIIETGEMGVLDNWEECEIKVKGKNANYQKFKTKKEAEDWIFNGASYVKKINKNLKYSSNKNKNVKLKKGIYFDAGTGRGKGVEVRVCDENKNSLINQILKSDKINEFENYNLGKDVTNNFGELNGLYLALNLAIKNGIKNIYGDSKLVIDYWSKGMIKNEVALNTQKLAQKVKVLREEFEEDGGIIEHISGNINPADLGFHKQ